MRDRLIAHFGPIVGMDSAIPPGVDWRTWIEERLAICDVAIVLIGRQWLTLTSAEGHRLGDPEDQLTHEIRTALDRDDVIVIPVLVQDARMPALSKLPSALRKIDRPQALKVSLQDWEYHGQRLVDEVERVLEVEPTGPAAQPVPTPDPDPDPGGRRWWILAVAAVAVIAVGAVAGWLVTRDGDDFDPMLVSPGAIVFGERQVNTTSDSAQVTVANDSSDPFTIQAFAIEPEGDFTLDDRECVASNPLPPSSSCTVRVAFRPGASDERGARLIVLRRGSPRAQIVVLSGVATDAPTPEPEPVVTTGTAEATTIESTDTEVSTLTEGPATTAAP